MYKIKKTNDDWKKILTPEQFNICRLSGTEIPFTGKYWDSKLKGKYHCICCGELLFSSEKKYDSGTGWPSFWDSLDKKKIKTAVDNSNGVTRTEIKCNCCDSHLGHVFDDGPEPTKLRYCVNSESLDFKKS